MRKLLTQVTRFLIVGGLGLVVDIALFNVLRLTILSPDVLEEGPLLAKLISTSVAILINWVGNRLWTFGTHGRARPWPEAAKFLLVSLCGMGIGLASLWISHYALGFTSVLADNISGNVIGLGLGSLFRFWFYRVWVFREQPAQGSNVSEAKSTLGADRPDQEPHQVGDPAE